jgi:hypothetical protein
MGSKKINNNEPNEMSVRYAPKGHSRSVIIKRCPMILISTTEISNSGLERYLISTTDISVEESDGEDGFT